MEDVTIQLRSIKFDHSPPKRKFRMMGIDFDAASTVHMFIAVAISGALYAMGISSGADMEKCLGLSITIVVLMGIYVVRFVRNRPNHYALDWVATKINPNRQRFKKPSSPPFRIK